MNENHFAFSLIHKQRNTDGDISDDVSDDIMEWAVTCDAVIGYKRQINTTSSYRNTLLANVTFIIDVNWHVNGRIVTVDRLSVEFIFYKILSAQVNALAKQGVDLLQTRYCED